MLLCVTHRLAEARSLAYHSAIARRLASSPQWIVDARERLARWTTGGTLPSEYAATWRTLLDGPLPDLIALLEADTEVARALRQVTPFAGTLSPHERWSIWRSTKERV